MPRHFYYAAIDITLWYHTIFGWIKSRMWSHIKHFDISMHGIYCMALIINVIKLQFGWILLMLSMSWSSGVCEWYILSWCWWNLLTSANQIAQIGSCDRSRIHVPDLGGTGVWPGKKSFHKKLWKLGYDCCIFNCILKIKVKKITNNKYELLDMIVVFMYVLEGNLQWNSWICNMIG